MTTTTINPTEIDAMLAALYHRHDGLQQRATSLAQDARRMCGDNGKIVRGRRVFTMTAEDAWAGVRTRSTDPAVHGPRPSLLLARLDNVTAELHQVAKEIDRLEGLHNQHGWTRFFVVTSSNGHVHSSRACSTCRLTTTFGWLPALSGQSEAAAVAELGGALCSVCFPSLRAENTAAKISKARAASLAA